MIQPALIAIALAAAAADPLTPAQTEELAKLQKSCGEKQDCDGLIGKLYTHNPGGDHQRACVTSAAACEKGATGQACTLAFYCLFHAEYVPRDLPRALALLKHGCEVKAPDACQMLTEQRERTAQDPDPQEADLDVVGTADEPVLVVGGERIPALPTDTAHCEKLAKKRLSFRLANGRPYKELYVVMEKLRACGVEEAGIISVWSVGPDAPNWFSLGGPVPAMAVVIEDQARGLVLRGGEVARFKPDRLNEQAAALGKFHEPVAMLGGGDAPLFTVIIAAQGLTWVKDGKKVFPKIFSGVGGLSPENLTSAFLLGMSITDKPLPDAPRPQLPALRPIFGESDLLRAQEVKMPLWTRQTSGFCMLDSEGKKKPVAFGVGFSALTKPSSRRDTATAKGRQALSRLFAPMLASGELKHPNVVKNGDTISMHGSYVAAEKEVGRQQWAFIAIEDLPIEKLAKEPCAFGEETRRLPLLLGPANDKGEPIGPPTLDFYSSAVGGGDGTPETYRMWRYQPIATDDAAAEKFVRAEALEGFKINFQLGNEQIEDDGKLCFKALDAEKLLAPGKVQFLSDPVAERKASIFSLDIKQFLAALPPECAIKSARARLDSMLHD